MSWDPTKITQGVVDTAVPAVTPDPFVLAQAAGQVPAGWTKDQYYAALQSGASAAGAAASAAGDAAANNAYANDPNDTNNPNSAASKAAADKAAADKAPGALSGPGPFEQWAADHGAGAYDHKSAAETLYDQGMAGTDPYYNQAIGDATQKINDASAARGNFNSSAALYDIGHETANLKGQQAAGMKDEAAASDAAYNSRVTGAENLYNEWQSDQEKRLGGAQSSATQLSQDQANVIAQAFKSAGDLSNTDNLEAFNAQLQKLGIDPAASATKDFLTLLGIGGSVATSK